LKRQHTFFHVTSHSDWVPSQKLPLCRPIHRSGDIRVPCYVRGAVAPGPDSVDRAGEDPLDADPRAAIFYHGLSQNGTNVILRYTTSACLLFQVLNDL